jgi:hypothetical protein
MIDAEHGSMYLYGSTSRAEAAADSDVDILVVCGPQKPADEVVRSRVDDLGLGSELVDVSFYGRERLAEMFTSGHLFAWHLFREAKFLGLGPDVLPALGRPAAYSGLLSDAQPLIDLLESIAGHIERCPQNVAYEAGIAFVCARNVAMSASYFSPTGPTFSPFAPYRVDRGCSAFPMSRDLYVRCRQARLATTRGTRAPSIAPSEVVSALGGVVEWARAVVASAAGDER